MQAQARPRAIALTSAAGRLSYAALDRRAEALAEQLRAVGVVGGSFVGLSSTRSTDLVVGMLGILKAGGAYVPLDPDYPIARRCFVVEDAQLRVLVAEENLTVEGYPPDLTVLRIPDTTPRTHRTPRRSAASSADPAYVIYTSGSTGKPKGVIVTHANVVGLLDSLSTIVPVGPSDVLAMAHSFAFDISVYEVWASLTAGACLWVPTGEVLRTPNAFHTGLREAGVTVLGQTPTAFRMLQLAEDRVPPPPALSQLRCILFAGERLDFRSLAPWIARYGTEQPRLLNLLGPTETTVYATIYELAPSDALESRSLIGRPLPSASLLVVDADGSPIEDEREGELAISGWGVSNGYLNRPELTAHRFQPLRAAIGDDTIWYLTGDRVRRLANGCLEFLGRADGQVKLRGHRIELAEIEAELREMPGICDTIVLLADPGQAEAELIAFYIPTENGPASVEFSTWVAARLPAVMRPSRYQAVAEFPRTVNGKLDRDTLLKCLVNPRGVDAAEDGLTQEMMGLFARLLRHGTIDAHKSFFEDGGHSLLAARLLAEIDQRWAVSMTFSDLLESPSPSELAERIRGVLESRRLIHSRGAAPPWAAMDVIVERQASQTPTAVAVVDECRALTYAELSSQANQWAHHLRRLGATEEARVAVSLPRSVDLVVATLAILKCGAVFVPIDPTQPAERRRALLADADVAVWIRTGLETGVEGCTAAPQVDVSRDRPIIANQPLCGVGVIASPDRVAYLLYTSGTTGTPHGVELTHHTLLELLAHLPLPSVPGTVLQWAAAGFDVSLQEVFYAFAHGARLLIPPEPIRRDPDALMQVLIDERVTDLFLPNTPLQWLMETVELHGATLPDLRRVHQAGEPLVITPSLRAFFVRHPDCTLANHYGPTETHVALVHTLSGHPSAWPIRPPIGAPVGRMQADLLDPETGEATLADEGELVLTGAAVGLGYRNRPERTAARFSLVKGERRYRTGDRVRRIGPQEFAFLGRVDREVKVRGYRVLLDDVEDELRAHPFVRQAVVRLSTAADRDPSLIAYVVLRAGLGNSDAELKSHLQSRLPAALVPTHIIELESLPVTANGKLNERALPVPSAIEPAILPPNEQPKTDSERTIAAAYATILGQRSIGSKTHFFDAGGNSLGAVRLIGQIHRLTGRRLSPQDVFLSPTVAELALRLESAPLLAWPESTRGPVTQQGPLSPAQTGMWFLNQTMADPQAYLVVEAFMLRGPLDQARLRASFRELSQRHPVLQTRYGQDDGNPVQRIDSNLEPDWTTLDLRDESGVDENVRVQRALEPLLLRPINLAEGPISRVTVLHLAHNRHLLVFSTHHIAVDGWSVSLLWRDWAELYASEATVGLPAMSSTYLDYAQEQHQANKSDRPSLTYWRRQLKSLPTLELPTDRPRPTRASHRGAGLRSELGGDVLHTARTALGHLRCTLHALLMATFHRLLSIYSSQSDFGIAFIAAGRDEPRWHDVVGMFANNLILRLDPNEFTTFRELVEHTQKRMFEALKHANTPFDAVVATLNPARSLSRQPFTDVMYAAQDIEKPLSAFADLQAEPFAIPFRTAKNDLLLIVTDKGASVELWWEYATDLYDDQTIQRFDRHFRALLTDVLRRPNAALASITCLEAAETQELLSMGAPTTDREPLVTTHALFARQASASPHAVALSGIGPTFTYAQLDRAANRLAHVLIEHGVTVGAPVGVMLPRDTQLIVALLAIWKAGGAYVPIDAHWPVARRRQIVTDAGIRWVLHKGSADDAAIEAASVIDIEALQNEIAAASSADPGVSVTPDSLAYLLFTSGSTGHPKAVETPHRGIVRLLEHPSYVRLDADTVLPFLSTLSFDAATFEIWGPLLQGGRLVVSDLAALSLSDLEDLIRSSGINTMWLTSAFFNVVIDERPEALTPVAQLLIGGEALSPHHVRLALARLPNTQLINGYGPTETTTFACTYPIPRDGTLPDGQIPIGRPIQETPILVVNEHLDPVPMGVPGELLIGGPGVALGYRGNADLTTERFPLVSIAGKPVQRFYRTGDRVRWRSDGQLAFLGRLDRQLKVRGHRIEPGEIESALLRHPAVRQAVVGVAQDTETTVLTACVVLTDASTQSVTSDGLRQFIRSELPAYLVPDVIRVVTALPLTANGKLDLSALLVVERATVQSIVEPTSETEKTICRIASELLNDLSVTPHDDFFALGGHSLLAVRLLARISEQFGQTISLASFFHDPSMASLARRIDGRDHESDVSRFVDLPGFGAKQLSLRTVRRAQGTREGVLVGVPGALGHAGEISFVAQHILPTFDVCTFSLDAEGQFSLSAGAPSLRNPEIFQPILDAVVELLAATAAIRPSALFGYSLGGYLAWRVEQALRQQGFPRIPVLNFDGGFDDRPSERLSYPSRVTTPAENVDPRPTPMLLVHRAPAGERQWQVRPLEVQWREQAVELSCLPVPTLDHLEVAVSSAIAPYADEFLTFIRSGVLPKRRVQHSTWLDTPGGRVYALLSGHRDREWLNNLLRDDLAEDGTVRLALLEAALMAQDAEGALNYALRILAVEPQQRAAANVIIGLSEARGDFATARRLKTEWIYGEPWPIGLRLSPRDAPIPAPTGPGALVIGYRPSLFAAAADLRFPTLVASSSHADGLTGWAFDPHAPDDPVLLDLLDGDTVWMTFHADQAIPGGVDQCPDGQHGFTVAWPADLPPERRATLCLRAHADGSVFAVGGAEGPV